ncbi:cation channel sperm-associated protein 1 [Elephas maximus indicus]|nr:cation channel sperm-associated protein 1 [Elephas maximus indicus]
MDQHSMLEKAHNEADTTNLDVVPGPHSLSPHHRPGHGGVHHHHESHHHSVSPHHGEYHHRGEFHDLSDNVFSRHSHHHSEAHHNGRAYHPYGGVRQPRDKVQPLNLNLSQGLFPSLHSYGEDHSHHTDSEYHHGNRMYCHSDSHPHSGSHRHSASHHHSGSHHRSGSHSHGGSPHHSGSHYHGENLSHHPYGGYYHHGRLRRHSEAYCHGEAHQDETHHRDEPYRDKESDHSGDLRHRGRFHHREGYHHGRPSHHEEAYSHQSNGGSYYSGSHHPHGEHYPGEYHPSEYHHGKRPHHGEHHHRGEHFYHGGHHHGQHRHAEPRYREHLQSPQTYVDYPHQHRYGDYLDGASQLSGTYSSYSRAIPSINSVTALHHGMPRTEHSGDAQAHSAIHSSGSQASSKVHPQATSTPEMESWSEDKQFQKRKTPRIQRTHKRLHAGDLSHWLCEKLSHFIHWLRKRLQYLIKSLAFEAFIFLIICLNTIMLVVQTFAEVEVRGEWYFMAMDSIFFCIYIVEAMLKIIALGFKYFSDSWNNLDFFIMVMAVLDFLLVQLNSSFSRSVYKQSIYRVLKVLKSLRALRAIRVLLRFSILTSLQEVTGTLARSLPSITAILILMFTCLFLFSVVLRALFRQSDPKRFRNIFTTIFTLFTMLTLDDWSLIYLDSRAQGAWYIIPILMIYIVIQYFIFLNLVIAVLVDNFQMALLKGLEKVKLERAARIREKLLDDSLTELSKAEAEEKMSEETMRKQLIEKKFGNMTEKQKKLLFHFLQLGAGVEHHQQKFRSQACVIDEIVDTTFEAGEEDFRK